MSSAVVAGDLSDEEDLEDMVNVMFDFSKYLKEKAKTNLPDLGVPRADINPVGWGDPDEVVEDTPFVSYRFFLTYLTSRKSLVDLR